jgi:hypothetical protein
MPLNTSTLPSGPASDTDLSPLPSVQLGVYRHYKGGLYEVQGVVRHSETLQPMVLYRALYGQRGLWVRPFDMFLETVQVADRTVSRFTWIADDTTAQTEVAV